MRKLGECKGGGLPYNAAMVRMGLSGPWPHVDPPHPMFGPSAPSPGLLETLAAQQALHASDAIFVDEAQDCTPGDKAFGTSVVSEAHRNCIMHVRGRVQ